MELVLYYSIGIVAVMALPYVVWVMFDFVWLTPKRSEKRLREQGFKGNPYKLLIGDIADYTKMLKEVTSAPMPLSNDIWPRLFPIIHRTTQAHGKNSFMWFGPRPGLIVTDPKLIKEILTNNFRFEKANLSPVLKLLIPGLIDHEGEKWVKHRKIINPAFHLEKLKLLVPAFHLSCIEMLSKLDNLVTKDGNELDIWPYIQTLTADGIARTAFGSNYNEGSEIFQLLREQTRLITGSINSIFIPGWRFLPTKANKRIYRIQYEMNASLLEIINKRLGAMETGESSKDDLLGILLDSNLKEINQHGNNKKFGMTTEDVIEECKLFYAAGSDTTSSLLVWTLILLSWNQDWQQRAREEVIQVFKDNMPNFDTLNHLKVMTMILNEVLRLYSPLFGMFRTVHKETKLGGMVIPAETVLVLTTTLLHIDPEIWGEDVKEFKPERFSDGVSKATKNRPVYLPFSMGPRVCIGQNFAMLITKMALVMLLRRFSFELSPSYAHAPLTVLALQPQYGAHLIIRKL